MALFEGAIWELLLPRHKGKLAPSANNWLVKWIISKYSHQCRRQSFKAPFACSFETGIQTSGGVGDGCSPIPHLLHGFYSMILKHVSGWRCRRKQDGISLENGNYQCRLTCSSSKLLVAMISRHPFRCRQHQHLSKLV